jgi:hypothetical protein
MQRRLSLLRQLSWLRRASPRQVAAAPCTADISGEKTLAAFIQLQTGIPSFIVGDKTFITGEFTTVNMIHAMTVVGLPQVGALLTLLNRQSLHDPRKIILFLRRA